ncbi:MAG: aminotransferase class I/II-fold pyridoxal phosphate-dependent enzyme [Acidimicrobiales bacterium]|nr:aminotransferase class I/II-fold pyridoxal phosphate-dependent enzyme [Acidimicrobiales bacterium]
MRASARSQVPPFEVMAILDRVAAMHEAGREVLSLCAGEPSGGAPADVRALASELHASGDPLGYTGPLGTAELRQAVADHHRRWYGLDVDARSVAITTGASGAFVLVFLAAFDAGDRVAVVRPGYPAYRNLLHALDLVPIDVPVGPESGFRLTVDALEAAVAAHGPLAGLVLASPANPTGSMVSTGQLAEIVAWCAANDVRFLSDEIYHGITYADPGAEPLGRGTCAWSLDRRTVTVSSFSKYWGMTGWRIGWALLPDDLVGPVDALAGNVALCPPTPSQRAALGAFTERSYAEADRAVEVLAATRRFLFESLGRLGWAPVAPADGAFYLWAGIGDQLGRHRDSVAWCRALLDETGVALVPGTDMDPVDGGGFVRLSFAASMEVVTEAVARIEAFQQQA